MPEKRNTPPEATGSPRSEDSAGRAFIFPRPENEPFLGYLPGPARARSHQSAGAGPGGPLLQLLPFGPAAPDPRAQDAQQRTRAHRAPGSERSSSPGSWPPARAGSPQAAARAAQLHQIAQTNRTQTGVCSNARRPLDIMILADLLYPPTTPGPSPRRPEPNTE
jgi:hypothetical protein